MKQSWRLLSIPVLLAAFLSAQVPAGLVDVFIVKLKPEKRIEFEEAAKKIADANYKHKGSRWIAYSTAYGEQNTIIFSSVLDNYAAIEKANEAFMSAMREDPVRAFPSSFRRRIAAC